MNRRPSALKGSRTMESRRKTAPHSGSAYTKRTSYSHDRSGYGYDDSFKKNSYSPYRQKGERNARYAKHDERDFEQGYFSRSPKRKSGSLPRRPERRFEQNNSSHPMSMMGQSRPRNVREHVNNSNALTSHALGMIVTATHNQDNLLSNNKDKGYRSEGRRDSYEGRRDSYEGRRDSYEGRRDSYEERRDSYRSQPTRNNPRPRIDYENEIPHHDQEKLQNEYEKLCRFKNLLNGNTEEDAPIGTAPILEQQSYGNQNEVVNSAKGEVQVEVVRKRPTFSENTEVVRSSSLEAVSASFKTPEPLTEPSEEKQVVGDMVIKVVKRRNASRVLTGGAHTTNISNENISAEENEVAKVADGLDVADVSDISDISNVSENKIIEETEVATKKPTKTKTSKTTKATKSKKKALEENNVDLSADEIAVAVAVEEKDQIKRKRSCKKVANVETDTTEVATTKAINAEEIEQSTQETAQNEEVKAPRKRTCKRKVASDADNTSIVQNANLTAEIENSDVLAKVDSKSEKPTKAKATKTRKAKVESIDAISNSDVDNIDSIDNVESITAESESQPKAKRTYKTRAKKVASADVDILQEVATITDITDNIVESETVKVKNTKSTKKAAVDTDTTLEGEPKPKRACRTKAKAKEEAVSDESFSLEAVVDKVATVEKKTTKRKTKVAKDSKEATNSLEDTDSTVATENQEQASLAKEKSTKTTTKRNKASKAQNTSEIDTVALTKTKSSSAKKSATLDVSESTETTPKKRTSRAKVESKQDDAQETKVVRKRKSKATAED